jgi:hypothetical protein
VSGMTISAESTQYVQVPVRAWSQGQPYNPTSLDVEMAFVSGWGPPVTWYDASWATTSSVNGYYLAQALVGPGSGSVVTLTQGSYVVWVQIAGDPETPVINCGTLTITV